MSFRAVRKCPFRGRSSLITFWIIDREPLNHYLADPMGQHLRVDWYPPVTNRRKPSTISTLLSNFQIFKAFIFSATCLPFFYFLHTLDEWRSSEYIQKDDKLIFRVQTRLSTIRRYILGKFLHHLLSFHLWICVCDF